MLGVADLARALVEDQPPRASGALALHELEVMDAIMRAAEDRSAVMVPGSAERPALLGEIEAATMTTTEEER